MLISLTLGLNMDGLGHDYDTGIECEDIGDNIKRRFTWVTVRNDCHNCETKGLECYHPLPQLPSWEKTDESDTVGSIMHNLHLDPLVSPSSQPQTR